MDDNQEIVIPDTAAANDFVVGREDTGVKTPITSEQEACKGLLDLQDNWYDLLCIAEFFHDSLHSLIGDGDKGSILGCKAQAGMSLTAHWIVETRYALNGSLEEIRLRMGEAENQAAMVEGADRVADG